jgi:hypothetical protein
MKSEKSFLAKESHMSGFTFRKSLHGGVTAPAELDLLGANSVVFQIGDAIRIDEDGCAALVTTGDNILGFVTGVMDANGLPITPDSGTLDTYTMVTANETTPKYRVKYIPALQDFLFSNDADDTLTDTMLFQLFDLNDENDVDVAGASDTTGQVRLIARDPDGDGDASKGLFQVVESFWAQAYEAGGIEA